MNNVGDIPDERNSPIQPPNRGNFFCRNKKKNVSGHWKASNDQKSGRIYYYNTVSKETTWNKPFELASASEQVEMQKSLAEKLDFFQDMENNIKRKIECDRRSSISLHELDNNYNILDQYYSNNDSRNRSGGNRPYRTISTIDDWELLNSLKPSKSNSHPNLSPLEEKNNPSSIGMSRSNSSNSHSKASAKEFPVSIQFHIKGSSFIEDDAKISYRDSSDFLSSKYDSSSDFDLDNSHHSWNNNNNNNGGTQLSESKYSYTEGDISNFREEHLGVNINNCNRKRRNSTGTLYVKNTMSSQDNDSTIMCVCAVIRSHIIHNTNRNMLPSKSFDIFLDCASPPSKKILTIDSIQEVPLLAEIKEFFTLIFSKSQLESECIIIALIYCERLVKETSGKLCFRSNNWKSIIFGCLVMASKVWDDLSMWNVDFSQVCSSFSLQKVNAFELTILEALNYVIRVSASEYAKYYFHLRSLMARLGFDGYDPRRIEPLNLIGARRLQLASERYEANRHDSSSSSSSTQTGGGSGKHDSNSSSHYMDNFIEALSPSNSFRVHRCRSFDNLDDDFFHHVTMGLEQIVHMDHNDADGATHKSPHK